MPGPILIFALSDTGPDGARVHVLLLMSKLRVEAGRPLLSTLSRSLTVAVE